MDHSSYDTTPILSLLRDRLRVWYSGTRHRLVRAGRAAILHLLGSYTYVAIVGIRLLAETFVLRSE